VPTRNDTRTFTYEASPRGDVRIYHGDILATTLRGRPAEDFLAKADRASPEAQQQLIARLTGNYKRGNERQARNHARNRA
jgi:hypothetical protein